LAAAFGLNSIVHMNKHFECWPVFPAMTSIGHFLYPQHSFAKWGDVVPLPLDELPLGTVEKVVGELAKPKVLSEVEAVKKAVEVAESSVVFERVKGEIEASIDREMKTLLAQHMELIEKAGLRPERLASSRMDLVRVWHTKWPPADEEAWPDGA
jgi:hypothetical protein